ncbi:MAG: prepilin-type N-terminal cleavage/methylation domain-containing protein [Phycisphaerales bacterium]|nr:MAG: prepilin-type N-terminal cleavage/methylation domain-containing protein [Phycisphaerales bacterium]
MISPTLSSERLRVSVRRDGFTLIEMVMTVAIMAVIMLGLGSAMIIAGHAVPGADNPAVAGIAAAEAAEQIATELQYAVSVVDSNATVIEFTLADRDGDDVAETIRYAWSGNPGDPLTRQYNAGPVQTLLTDVSAFDFSYDLATTTTEKPQGNESGETLLVEHASVQDLHDYPIKDTERYAQYFFPSLPADAVSWKVTRVRFYAKVDGTNDGQYSVQLQLSTTGDTPSSLVLEARPALESSLLDGYAQQEILVSNVSGLSPQEGLCLVFHWTANGTACKIQGQDRNVATANSYLAKSTDRGASWSLLSNQSLLYQVYGTVTTAGEPVLQNTYHLDRMDIALKPGGALTAVQTGVRLLNRPEVVQ